MRKILAESKDIEDTGEVNSLWDTFKSSLLTAIDQFVPHIEHHQLGTDRLGSH